LGNIFGDVMQRKYLDWRRDFHHFIFVMDLFAEPI